MNRSLLVAVLGVLAAFTLSAQTINLKATIPFEFRLGSAALPAGDYGIYQSNGVLTLRTATGAAQAAMTLVQSAHRPATDRPGTLVFHRYGSHYFLANVWTPNSPTGFSLKPGKLEKELRSRANVIETAGIALRK